MIYVKGGETAKTPKELVQFMFTSKKSYSSEYRGSESFSDKEHTKLQCEEFKYRSITDIMTIFKTYFPNVSMEEMVFSILSTRIQGKRPRFGICSTVMAPTMLYGDYDYGVIGTEYMDQKYDAIMSWNDFVKYVEVKTFTMVLEFNNLTEKISFEDYKKLIGNEKK